MVRRRAVIRLGSLAFIGLIVVAGVVAGYLAISTSQYQGQTTTSTESQTITKTVSTTAVTSSTATTSSGNTNETYFPCPSPGQFRPPDESQIIVNGTTVCVSGPAILAGNDGRIDFRNGSVVDLHANTTGSAMILGLYGYDTVVVTNGTRLIFNASRVIATLYPYQGKEVFANGTITTFPPCIYPVSPDPQQSGEGANGTVWFSGASVGIVRFYPNGTCSAANG